jgi:hypothetical protein
MTALSLMISRYSSFCISSLISLTSCLVAKSPLHYRHAVDHIRFSICIGTVDPNVVGNVTTVYILTYRTGTLAVPNMEYRMPIQSLAGLWPVAAFS